MRPNSQGAAQTAPPSPNPLSSGAAEAIPIERAAYFDLETTGLSGGSGTLAFLATVARFEGRDLILRQTFIDDYPGEPEFLEVVVAQLMEASWVVSYNGASFDLPLLQSRCVINRIPPPLLRQIDILHDCRRLWSFRSDFCTLAAMEDTVLSKRRDGDIPGALVPRVWLDYVKAERLREEQSALMALVWRHNLEDVISLAELFLVVESAYRNPSEALVRHAIDPGGLAKSLLRLGRQGEAKSILLSLRDDPERFDVPGNLREKALRQLAAIARREGDRDLLADTVFAMDSGSVEGCIAKAKFCEHRNRDAAAALGWALRAADILGAGLGDNLNSDVRDEEELRGAIEHRLARLRAKLERGRTESRTP